MFLWQTPELKTFAQTTEVSSLSQAKFAEQIHKKLNVKLAIIKRN